MGPDEHLTNGWQRETAPPDPDPYEASSRYEAAVGALHDPLTDPLPPEFGGTEPYGGADPYGGGTVPYGGADAPPPAEAHGGYGGYGEPYPGHGGADPAGYGAGSTAYGWSDAPVDAGGPSRHDGTPGRPPADGLAYPGGTAAPVGGPDTFVPGPEVAEPFAQPQPQPGGVGSDDAAATVLIPPVGDPEAAATGGPSAPDGPAAGATVRGTGAVDPETLGLRRTRVRPEPSEDGSDDGAATGGRAARRRAERARKRSRANRIANVAGELMITTGVVLVLFVTYQLWWTNVEARAYADGEAEGLLEQWEGDGGGEEAPDAGEFSPGDGFALLYIPELDVRVPIAEGVDEPSVLDRGMVGRYSAEDGLPTAMPWDDEGNVGLAGHRNTHGEPFRYINRLDEGDPIVIETESTFYVYEMRSRLDSTDPSNTAVLDPVPDQGGFTDPGRYLTLTTCTPEFSSTYRLIVWGELVEEQPRSEGMPDALVT